MESTSSNPQDDAQTSAETVLQPKSGTAPDGVHAAHRENYGRFKVIRTLGSGGFSDVLLAHDPQLDRSVAIKIPRNNGFEDSAGIQQFAEEARTAARLQHPNIVQVYDVGVEDNACYIVLEYVRGRTLEQVLSQEKLSYPSIALILSQVAGALHHAHEMGFVHRDVKPANILLDNEDRPRVSDFGLAVRHTDQNAKQQEVAGTTKYMSPEQARGESHRFDGRTDIWGLGVVLYLALTKKLPFDGGTRKEIFSGILYQDPVSPRQVMATVPEELERICLKCLSRQMGERYRTARELADDLTEWREIATGTSGRSSDRRGPVKIDPPAAPLIPRGLRAFGKDDSDFFLRLVPGPRDRDGLPTTLSFWKSGIESRDSEAAFRVGLLYGPSGCGKSSLLKAGLLPRIRGDVRPVFVDASLQNVEESLLRALQKIHPEMQPDLSLSRMLQQRREDPRLSGERKLLLIIDQFEQWLQSWNFGPDAGLIAALRQCDGVNVQCLILVRDDFWLPISRFMHSLEVRIIEGQNSMLIDSFDAGHAVAVLREFGVAYHCLPEDISGITPDQQKFMNDAVAGLSVDGRLYPVRLAVFVEMFRRMQWTPESLASLGGPDGVGVAFLECMFGATASQSRQIHEPIVRRMFGELLPATGQIKGPVCSYSDLQKASGCANDSATFDEVIRLLDSELRIITPASQAYDETSDELSARADASSSVVEPAYQLTHDFLVPAIRRYLERGARSTRGGRAMLLLAQQAEIWSVRPLPRFLPSFWEWMTVKLSTSAGDWNPRQRAMMAAANRRVFRYFLQGSAVFALVVLVAWLLVHRVEQNEFRRNAQLAVHRLTSVSSGGIEEAIDNTGQFLPVVRTELQSICENESLPLKERMRAAVALLPVDSSWSEWLVLHLINPSTPPDDFVPLQKALARYAAQPVQAQLLAILNDQTQTARSRFRAACLLSEYVESRDYLKSIASEIFHSLLREPATSSSIWIETLLPASSELRETFAKEFVSVEKPEHASVAAAALYELNGTNVSLLAAQLDTANDVRYRAIIEILQQQTDVSRTLLEAMLSEPFEFPESDEPPPIDPESLRIVNLSMALWQLGNSDSIRNLATRRPSPDERTMLIHSLTPSRIDTGLLLNVIREAEADDPLLNVSLAACVSHIAEPISESAKKQLTERLQQLFRAHPDPETHSCADLLLRKLDIAPLADVAGADPVRQLLETRDWYINAENICMVVVRPEQLSRRSPAFKVGAPNHSFAISATEVTQAQLRRLLPRKNKVEIDESSTEDCPAGSVNAENAAEYCQRLNEQAGIADSESCYRSVTVSNVQTWQPVDDYLSRSGYRLPTDEEWLYTCRCGTTAGLSFGNDSRYLRYYAWCVPLSGGHGHPVGTLLPNNLGVFDFYGNVNEICFTRSGGDGEYSVRGGNFYTPAEVLDNDSSAAFPPGSHQLQNGFRVVQTISR